MVLDAHPILEAVLQVGVAFLLALPVGWAREQRSRSAGLRTYPLLSLGVCGFLVVAESAGWKPREQADAFYGVLSGMGFVGSGAIVKSRDEAAGMSTAASLWVTGAIGAGVAYGFVALSAALSLVNVAMLWVPSLVARWRRTS